VDHSGWRFKQNGYFSLIKAQLFSLASWRLLPPPPLNKPRRAGGFPIHGDLSVPRIFVAAKEGDTLGVPHIAWVVDTGVFPEYFPLIFL
jgi:hypothetical protein